MTVSQTKTALFEDGTRLLLAGMCLHLQTCFDGVRADGETGNEDWSAPYEVARWTKEAYTSPTSLKLACEGL